MNEQRKRIGGWAYLIPVVALLLGCLLATFLFVGGIGSLVTWALDLVDDVEQMQRVVVPGSTELTLSDAGQYAVFYEYRSVLDGEMFRTSRVPPAMLCTVTSETSGKRIEVRPAAALDANYEMGPNARAGIWIMSFEVDKPGVYEFTCDYAGDRQQSRTVLAVGQNIIWDALRRIPARVGSLLGSFAVCFGAVFLALVAVVAVFLMRQEWKASPPPAAS